MVIVEPNLCVTGLIFAGNTKCATRQNKAEPVRKTGFAGWMLLLLHYSIVYYVLHCRMTVKKIATATKRWPWNTVRTHIAGVSECKKYWLGQVHVVGVICPPPILIGLMHLTKVGGDQSCVPIQSVTPALNCCIHYLIVGSLTLL